MLYDKAYKQTYINFLIVALVEFSGNIHGSVNGFGLGGIDLWKSKNRDFLLPIYQQICCCEYVRNTADIYEKIPIYDIYKNNPGANLDRWSWGRWRVSEAHCNCYTNHLLSIWMLSSKLIGCWCEKNPISCAKWIMMSLYHIDLEPNDLCHLEFHYRNLDSISII